MSLSSTPDGGFARPSGKTPPPPAPSAAFAKRARELQAQESLGGARYRPPALRSSKDTPSADDAAGGTIGGDPSALAPPAFPPGFRRARAGTLPSNVQLAAQRYASTLPAAPLSDYEQTNEINNNTGINLVTSNSTRPSLRHANSMAPAVPSATIGGERNSRLRSGSLTLPSAGLSNAFGPSIFSSSWLSNNGAGFPVLDEMRSITSGDSIMGADEYDVHTLDYLGLDDGPGAMTGHGRPMPVPATVSELRNQAQAAIVGHQTQNPSRNRSQTISNFARARSGTTSMITAPTIEHSDDEEEDLDYASLGNNYGRQRMDSFEGNNGLYGGNSYVAKGFRQSQHLGPNTSLLARPRAISVGVLDDPNRAAAQRRSAAANAAIEQSSASLHRKTSYSNMNDANQSILGGNASYIAAPTSILRQPSFNLDDESSAAYQGRLSRQNSASVRFPSGDVTAPQMGINAGRQVHLTAPIVRGESRSVSPKAEGMPNQIQTPSRSLWIGNLDPAMTGEDLAHVFAPYGAIESFRLLPEKECGFVNFVDIADAIRAKEDVLNRLSGHIGMTNNQAVRIGFGKADSAPATPPMGTQQSSAGIGLGAHIQSQFNAPGQAPQMQSQANALDSQLQSSPTRALWIGSIPSTTTPATILSVFSPYGPIESARVLTHKNCGFVNFERLDDAVRARKALNGRDVLGSDVGAIRIGFARVPVKNAGGDGADEGMGVGVQGVGDLTVGGTIHALRTVKGASTIPADQQVLGGSIENYRSNLLLSMIGSGTHQALGNNAANPASRNPTITEQQMVMLELSGGAADAEADIKALGEFRPPTMYYSTIPLVAERPHNRRWDASKLRELRKRLDSGTCGVEEIDAVAADFLDGEIVDLASDWLGNTVVQKLFEKCSPGPRLAMLDRIAPHLAMIGIHKNGTWAAQKIIECSTTPEEVAMVATNLRAYAPPLLLDQFGNYVIQCCLRFGSPQNDFIFDAVVDRLWEVAQGRFGARSMRACLESPQITISQQRKIATAIVLNSIPLATNPNGALLLTWLLDSSGFHSRYKLLAPRFTPHLAHLCTHKLASLTVLRIVNQRIEPEASQQIVHSLFNSPGDHVLTDVLGDQVNGVSVVHKILISPFLDPVERPNFLEATKRVLIDLKVTVTQAYRRLIEEVGLPLPNFQPAFAQPMPQPVKKGSGPVPYGMPGMPTGYPQQGDGLATMMQALQLQAQQQGVGPNNQGGLQINPGYGNPAIPNGMGGPPSGTSPATFSPTNDPFNPFARSPEMAPRGNNRRGPPSGQFVPQQQQQQQQQQQLYSSPQGTPSLAQAGNGLMGMAQPSFGMPPNSMPPQMYQAYMQQGFMQPNSATFHT